MEKNKTCCIITNDFCNFNYIQSSKQKKERIKERVISSINEILEEEKITTLISALETGVDLFATQYILKNKNIFLECALSFEEQASSYKESERDKYFSVLERCDKLTLVNKKRVFGCKTKRDKYMIENCDIILCFWDKIAPYTGELLQYAASLNKKIAYI